MLKKIILSTTLLVLLVHYAFADDISLPAIGNDQSNRFSQAEEKLLGEAFMRQVRLGLPVSSDPEVADYISHLGFRLIANSEFQSHHFHFFVVNDTNINAFAGPNGYIGINAGLILKTENESELASVVAHEIAHVTQRHLERTFESNDKLSLSTAAAIIAAIVLGSSANINLTEAAIFAALAANTQSQLSHSRIHEMEADNIGIKILKNSDFDPHAMPSFFEKLQQASGNSDDLHLEFLRTHPVTVNRIAESRNRASKITFQLAPDNFIYHLSKAKLRVMTEKNVSSLVKKIEAELKAGSYQNKFAQIYAYALALFETEKFNQASKQIDKLIKMDRERIHYLILKANIKIGQNKLDEGFKIFRESLTLNPGNPSISLHYADALLTNKQPVTAKKTLLNMDNYRSTPLYYQLMAKAEDDAGLKGASHQMLAEYFLMFAQIGLAINHLKQALTEKDTTEIDERKIKKRIREIKEIARLEEQL